MVPHKKLIRDSQLSTQVTAYLTEAEPPPGWRGDWHKVYVFSKQKYALQGSLGPGEREALWAMNEA